MTCHYSISEKRNRKGGSALVRELKKLHYTDFHSCLSLNPISLRFSFSLSRYQENLKVHAIRVMAVIEKTMHRLNDEKRAGLVSERRPWFWDARHVTERRNLFSIAGREEKCVDIYFFARTRSIKRCQIFEHYFRTLDKNVQQESVSIFFPNSYSFAQKMTP